MSQYRKDVRAAMKWWRAANPEKSKYVRLIQHGWSGHVLWTSYGDGGALMDVREVITQWRAATQGAQS
jgi:hypothetical protein